MLYEVITAITGVYPNQQIDIHKALISKGEIPLPVITSYSIHYTKLYEQSPMGQYTEQVLASDLIAPAHIQAIDFDGDGDKDLMIAVLGMLFPNNDKIGSIVSYNFV